MGWFHDQSNEAQSYEQATNAPHKAKLSHEIIAAAAAYEASKAYEKHVAANGKPASHAEAKELIAGLTAAFVDRIVETKGLNFIDKEETKREASKKVDAKVASEY
ncbi:hypothetical protein BV25DRAFT_1817748 [Artomyces pyxidatus]|uniref:Uncharacterized protein n=1 Tax=Artomyces pyxidatus TaxID=48021 RepID=A0ACB8TKA5_9AGAM|nr:hypothetical protein BV25DRAFT_1817748 [Artomyces pyxidatus]